MRYLLILGVLIFALALLGCGSNSAGDMTGPGAGQAGGASTGNGRDENIIGPPTRTELAAQRSELSSSSAAGPDFDPNDEYIGPPTFTNVEEGFYGTVSNLNLGAGTFTLTSPSGNTQGVVAGPNAMVLYLGKMFELGDSPLADGMNVAVTATVSGLPAQAKVRATLIVINKSPTNEGLVVFQGL